MSSPSPISDMTTKQTSDGEETKTISMGGFDITVAPSPCSKEKSKTAEESIVTESTGTMTDALAMASNNTDLSDICRRIKENNLCIAEKNAEISKIQEEIVEKTVQNENLLLDLFDFVEFFAEKLAIMEQQKKKADAELQAQREHFTALSEDFTAAFSRLGDFHDRLLSLSGEE